MVLDQASIATFDANGNPISTFAEEVASIIADYQTIKTAFEEFIEANIMKFKWYHYTLDQNYTNFPLSKISDLVYNPLTDTMLVFNGNQPLIEGDAWNYTRTGSSILFETGWALADNNMHFLILRGYKEELGTPTGDGALIMNGSITLSKMDISVQNLINSILNKADNTDATRTTTNKTVTGAINELNSLKADKTGVVPYIDYGSTVASANTLLTRGLYRCDSWTVPPSVLGNSQDKSGLILSIPFNDNFIKQTYYCTYHMDKVFERSKINGTWHSWRRVMLDDSVVPFFELGTTSTNMNTMITRGIFVCSNFTNCPSSRINNKLGILTVYRYSDTYVQQTYNLIYDSEMYIRNLIGGTWSEWQKVATTSSKTLTLVNNWVAYDNIPNISVSGQIANVNMRIRNGLTLSTANICNLGYIPFKTGSFFQVYNAGGANVGSVYVDSSGFLKVQSISSNGDCCINFSYNII